MKETMLLQRKILGILCAVLTPSCILFGLLGDNLPYWYCSVSATYYANSKICMIGLLAATSVFFFSYKGYDWKDRLLSCIQAVAALGVIVFPCSTPMAPERTGLFNLSVNTSHIFHCISACTLFFAFATNIMFLFTLGNNTNEQKRKRNIIYRVCGGIIYAICLWELVAGFLPIPQWFPLTMIDETIMLEAFAVAWLVKSESVFKDRK